MFDKQTNKQNQNKSQKTQRKDKICKFCDIADMRGIFGDLLTKKKRHMMIKMASAAAVTDISQQRPNLRDFQLALARG